MFSSLPGLFLNSIRLPAQTKDYKPQHPCFVVFRICQIHKSRKKKRKAAAMFSSSPLPQLHCKLFAKMGDDRPFVCNAPGCGQVSLLPLYSGFQVLGCGGFLSLCTCVSTLLQLTVPTYNLMYLLLKDNELKAKGSKMKGSKVD